MMLLNDLIGYGEAWGKLSPGGGVDLDPAWLRESRIREDASIEFVPYWDAATPAAHGHKNLYVSVWKRDGWCAAILVNYGPDRIEAEVAFDPERMGFSGVAPAAIRVRDVDPSLVSYFEDDLTKLEKPKPKLDDPLAKAPDELEDFSLEEPPTLAERKAADPDGKFEWKDGVLRAPVRGYDFRLFEFKVK
jgi:hypothetical protein